MYFYGGFYTPLESWDSELSLKKKRLSQSDQYCQSYEWLKIRLLIFDRNDFDDFGPWNELFKFCENFHTPKGRQMSLL